MSSFPNELTYFTKNPQNSCILSNKKLKENEIIEFRFIHKSRRDYKIQIQINIDNSISVFTTLNFLKRGLWERLTINLKSNQRKGKKFSPKEKTHIYYQISFNPIKNSTKSLFDHNPLIFHLLDDFSFVFDFFARKISLIQMNTDEDTRPIREYRELFVNIKSNSIRDI